MNPSGLQFTSTTPEVLRVNPNTECLTDHDTAKGCQDSVGSGGTSLVLFQEARYTTRIHTMTKVMRNKFSPQKQY